MTHPAKPLRADAARNRARVLEVAYETFAAEGLSVPIDEIVSEQRMVMLPGRLSAMASCTSRSVGMISSRSSSRTDLPCGASGRHAGRRTRTRTSRPRLATP